MTEDHDFKTEKAIRAWYPKDARTNKVDILLINCLMLVIKEDVGKQ